MQLSDDPYNRDRLRLEVALRFIRHEARTCTIRQWTGLSDARIRKLYRSYLQSGARTTRHRGKSPRQPAHFLRTSRMRDEASALASLCCLVGLFDEQRRPAPPLAGVERAASLCRAYEGYQATVIAPAITFEHAVLLVNALTLGRELRFGECQHCGALLVVDSLGLRATLCALCSGEAPRIACARSPSAPPP